MSGSTEISIPTENAMTAVGARIATHLVAGDTILLSGPIGAGKTHLARSIIAALLDEPEEIPSPTYTLVQTYVTEQAEIWHADLYRLADSSELVELGLDDAMTNAIVLIEWPDRLPQDALPKDALSIDILTDGDHRTLRTSTTSDRWCSVLKRLSDA